jgi:hypothetical protein
MSKPTVFFSHSSADKRFLTAFKELFIARTGGAIDVFLSSDGQSIRLGQNWVYRIQEALEHSRLMLVFISPSSVGSPWLYFEAGFAYSKGMRVVPIGILGVEIASLSPPITLLQGFNLKSADGLGNVIALVNEVFEHTHATDFTPKDYFDLFPDGGAVVPRAFGDHTDAINELTFTVRNAEDLLVPPEQVMDALEAELKSRNASYERLKFATLRAFGLTASFNSLRGSDAFSVHVEPVLADITIPVVQSVLSAVVRKGYESVESLVTFQPGVGGFVGQLKVTARLHGFEVQLAEKENALRFQNIQFEMGFGQAPALFIRPLDNILTVQPLAALIDLLFERGVLFYGELLA